MSHGDKIVRDPQICGGEPVLASLADGDSVEDSLSDFPALKAEHVLAAIAFAAGVVRPAS
jgi:uncharacterized protein (DUF433 family)